MLLVKTVCVINVTLIIILSLFYKLIYHTYSTIIYNHLCTRFSIAETLVVISVRFFAIFAPYIVWTASNQNQNNINRDTTIQVFYNLGLLGLCLTKLSNYVVIQRIKFSTLPISQRRRLIFISTASLSNSQY